MKINFTAMSQMISKIRFKELAMIQKGELVFQEGQYIGMREYYNYNINLYSLYDYSVEVWYSPTKNRIEKIELLKDEKTLDLYIDKMNELESELKLFYIFNH